MFYTLEQLELNAKNQLEKEKEDTGFYTLSTLTMIEVIEVLKKSKQPVKRKQ